MRELSQKIAVIDGLAGNFGHEMPEATKKLWLEMLAPYPAALVSAGARVVLAEYEFKTMPPFAVLQKAIDRLSGDSKQVFELQALAEWDRLQSDICLHGYYQPPTLHPTTAFVVRLMGGWEAACAWKIDDMPFRRREFIQHWQDCHGKTEMLALGADGVKHALSLGGGVQSLGQILATALPSEAHQ